jgi:hypothetical protein
MPMYINTFTKETQLMIINANINTVIVTLKYLETLTCREVLPKDIIDAERQKATHNFKLLLTAKEALRYEK